MVDGFPGTIPSTLGVPVWGVAGPWLGSGPVTVLTGGHKDAPPREGVGGGASGMSVLLSTAASCPGAAVWVHRTELLPFLLSGGSLASPEPL